MHGAGRDRQGRRGGAVAVRRCWPADQQMLGPITTSAVEHSNVQAHVVTRSLMAVVRAWSGEKVALRG